MKVKNQSTFIEKLSILSGKIQDNKYLKGISQGCTAILPIIIIGAFASLFSGLPVSVWQKFIQSTGIAAILTMVVNATTNMLGVYFAYGVSKTLAKELEVKSGIVPVLSMAVYLMLLPTSTLESGDIGLAFDYTGAKGMIVGILIAFLSTKLVKFFEDKNITIKMPEGTPSYVSNSFASLIPGFVVMIVAMIIRGLCQLTPYGDVFNLLYNILQIPLTAIIGGSVVSNTIIIFLTQILWGFGIHPGFLSSMTGPILMGLDGMNQAAYAAGEALPNIIGLAFSYITTIATLYPAIAIAVLIFSKSKQLKTVGKVAVAPAFFGISEPLIFGLPVVLNPIIIIPWVIAPIVNFVLGYFVTSIGLVHKCAGVIVFNFPMVITGLLNGSVTISIMEVVLFVIDILLFAPFIKAIDRKMLKNELEASTNEK